MSPTSQTTSVSLINAVKLGDSEAWSRLVTIYTPLVYQWARAQRLQPADAADVAQEVFLAVAKGIHEFRRVQTGDSFRAWFRTIFRSKLNDLYRKQQRQPPLSAAPAELAAESPPIHIAPTDELTERRLLVWRTIDCIKGDFKRSTWEAFWRTVVEGHRPVDVAADLGMKPSAVCMCRQRVLRRIRETLSED